MDTMHRRKEDELVYRYLKAMTFLTLGLVVVLASLLCYWSLYPYHPIDTQPKPYTIVYPKNKIVEQGSYITYEFKYNKTSKVIPTIHRQFVDGLVFNVAENIQPTVSEPGTGTARVQIHVPETLPPGKYQLKIIATYQMNPIRTYENVNLTEKFEVVPAKKKTAYLGR